MKLVVVDDHPMLRLAMREVLRLCDPTLEVVGEASTVRDAIVVVAEREPDVVVMDMMLPGTNGASGARDVRAAAPDCRILIYTALVEPGFAVDALAAGANGYAVKTDGIDELVSAIRQVGRGERYVAPSIEKALGEGIAGREQSSSRTLSTREREIFDLIVAGYSNRRLAGTLFISVKTVETHRSRINKKLGVHSTAELIRFAALNGLFAM